MICFCLVVGMFWIVMDFEDIFVGSGCWLCFVGKGNKLCICYGMVGS